MRHVHHLAALLGKTNKQTAQVYLKNKAGKWRLITADPAGFGKKYTRR